jgi:hypothetical protein
MALVAYSYTGSAVVYNVTVTKQYAIALWGAGAGAGRYSGTTLQSGGGGFTLLRINLTAGDVLTVEVGQGGGPGIGAGTIQGGYGGWPDGGWGARGDVQGGGGGGSSRVWLNGTLWAVAGAGGGASGYSPGGHGGAGGGVVGQSAEFTNGGTGGTQTAGGFDQGQPTNVPKQGKYLQGGFGAGNVADRFTTTSDDGGGGGGGYYGGGGGGGDGHSGGGGSSWADDTRVVAWLSIRGNFRQAAEQANPYYVAGVGMGAMSTGVTTGGLPGGDGRVVIDDNPPVESFLVGKATGYGVLQVKPGVYVSKASIHVVLKEAEPVPIDFEFLVSKAMGYAVIKPGSNGPLTTVTHTAAEVVHGGLPRARITNAAIEALQSRKGAARVTGAKLESLYTRLGAARLTYTSLEVLRSTAEVTVQGLVTHAALSVLFKPEGAEISVSHVAVEVLRTAEAENERFAVVSLMN